MADILRARILAIACGYPDANDLQFLRKDPAFKLACGRLPESGDDLASQPTMSRWENAPDVLSMAARNSPKSSGRNSPLHSELVTAKSSRRSDIGEGIEVEIDDLLKRLSGGAVAQAFGQGVGPGGILGL
jgi:hypothetical protein